MLLIALSTALAQAPGGPLVPLAYVPGTRAGNIARFSALSEKLKFVPGPEDERPLEVTIAARHVQRAWRIEITDNGRGVPPAERQRIFEPLARVDDSLEGTGIGLAACRRIVGAHGGRIGIDASVTEGARFWFELPD